MNRISNHFARWSIPATSDVRMHAFCYVLYLSQMSVWLLRVCLLCASPEDSSVHVMCVPCVSTGPPGFPRMIAWELGERSRGQRVLFCSRVRGW